MRPTLASAVLAAGCLIGAPAGAATISGTFDISNLADQNVTVTDDSILWDGVRFTEGTGDFAALVGTDATLLDLVAVPVGVSGLGIENFFEVDARPAWNFILQEIDPGTGTLAGCGSAQGTTCTPFPESPFTITNTGSDNGSARGSSVALNLRGTVSDGSDSPISTFEAIFSTQFVELTSGELLAMIDDEGSVDSSYSGSFIVEVTPNDVPEPAGMALLGLGLFGLAYMQRRRRVN